MDSNEKSLDGFSPETGWVRVDLTELFAIHRVYEVKRKRLQREGSKKSALRKVLAKYSRREKNRANDYIHKLTTSMVRMLRSRVRASEDEWGDEPFKGAQQKCLKERVGENSAAYEL